MNSPKDNDPNVTTEVDREIDDLKTSLTRLQDAMTPAIGATKEAFGATREAIHQVHSAWSETKETLAVRRRIEERPIAALGVSAAVGFLLGSRRSRGASMLGKATGALASIAFMRLAETAVTYATAKLLNERDQNALPAQSANGELMH